MHIRLSTKVYGFGDSKKQKHGVWNREDTTEVICLFMPLFRLIFFSF